MFIHSFLIQPKVIHRFFRLGQIGLEWAHGEDMQREQTLSTLVSADPDLIHLAQASAAAIGASLGVVAEPSNLQTVWRTASSILIGADLAEQVAMWALPRRGQVYLVGRPEVQEVLCQWSTPLGASVILVPKGGKWLSQVIAGRLGAGDAGVAVAVKGGAGGLGASTLAVGLALTAAKRSLKVALIDDDPGGGGLDLLLGAESAPGWRWDKLRQASGQIADITGMLPRVEGVTLVSMERSDPAPVPDQAREAVIDCLARSHDLVLVDAGRGAGELTGMVRRCLVVSARSVRVIAATRTSLGDHDGLEAGLVLRKGGSVPAGEAARAIGLPLISGLPTVKELPRLADRGVPPAVGGGWRKSCATILDWCLGEYMMPRRSI